MESSASTLQLLGLCPRLQALNPFGGGRPRGRPPKRPLGVTGFEVSVAIQNGCQVVTVGGDLDSDTALRLDGVLDRLVAAMPVIVDLAGVVMVTSAGVQALLD